MIKKLILSLLLLSCIYAQTAVTPAAGSGTEEDPYQIATLENLYWITENPDQWNKNYIQIDDINAEETVEWFEGLGWEPIGNLDTLFTGSYNGNKHIIKNVYLKHGVGQGRYKGFFGAIKGASIYDLGLEDVNIEGWVYVGGLVGGVGSESTIERCYTTGIVNSGSSAGGLAGIVTNSLIKNCYSRCITSGEIKAGLVCTLSSSYPGSRLYNSYTTSTDKIVSSGDYVYNCFYRGTDSNESSLSEEEFMNIDTYINAEWNIYDVWGVDPQINDGYPHLFWSGNASRTRIQSISDISDSSSNVQVELWFIGKLPIDHFGICWSTDPTPSITSEHSEFDKMDSLCTVSVTVSDLESNTVYYVRPFTESNSVVTYGETFSFQTLPTPPEQGDGSIEDPYQVANLNDLNWIAIDKSNWDKHYIQVCDIDATDMQFWQDGKGCRIIGDSIIPFTGTYNGQGFIITNLYHRRTDEESENQNFGMFGFIKNATISNLGIVDAYFRGADNSGILAGCTDNSKIIQCFTTGEISANDYVGGLIGTISGGTIIANCYNRASVSGFQSRLGGLVGMNYNSSIYNSYSTGKVSSGWSSGGLVGHNYGNTGCYASFWDLETSGWSTSDGGTGKITKEMKEEATYLNAGWDFNNIWDIDTYRNEGYPYIKGNTTDIAPLLKCNSSIFSNTNTAEFTVEVVFPGDPSASEFGIVYEENTSPNGESERYMIDTLTVSGSYTRTINDLSEMTKYKIRPYVIWNGEIHLYTIKEFITDITPVEPNGNGTDLDPFVIGSIANLYWMASDSSNWDKHYIQTDDINARMSRYRYHSSDHYGWVPIGSQENPFTGIYDGQGFAIDSLYIKYTQNRIDDQGLFGVVKKAELKNLGICNSSIIASNYSENIGMIAGFCDSSSIYRCFSSGETGGNHNVGGLVGYLLNSNIDEGYSNTRVFAFGNYSDWTTDPWKGSAGGIAGVSQQSEIADCYSIKTASGRGYTKANPITRETASSSIRHCYGLSHAWSYLSPDYLYCGLPGEGNFCLKTYGNDSFIAYINSFRTVTEMKDRNMYINAGWDLASRPDDASDHIWSIDETGLLNAGFPYLSWQETYDNFPILPVTICPKDYELSQNYPNPFNPTTTISYQLPAVSDVELAIYDISGRKINQWSYQNQNAGTYEMMWDSKDLNGNSVPSGVYIYRMTAGDFISSKKMLLLK